MTAQAESTKFRSASPGRLFLALIATLLLSPAFPQHSFSQDETIPRHPHASFAEKPGRLFGWGLVGREDPLNLPQGADAEGFIAVANEYNRWIALKADGTVVTGGNRTNSAWANEAPKLVESLRVVDVAMGPGAVILYDNGFVQAIGGGNFAAPPEILRDIVSISGGTVTASALRKDGKAFVWGGSVLDLNNSKYNKEVHEQIKGLIESDVARIKSGGEFLYIEKTDGARHLFQFPRYTDQTKLIGDTSFDSDSLFIGRFQAFYRKGDGNWGGWESDSRNAAFPLPKFPEPVVEIRGDGHSNLARLESGRWMAWGDSKSDLLNEPRRLECFLTFEFRQDFRQDLGEPGHVIGIEPSYVESFEAGIPASAPPELRAELTLLDGQRKTARTPPKAWDDRYLSELGKLEAKTRNPKPLARIQEETSKFRDRTRPISGLAPLARLQNIYREKAAQLEAESREKTLALYDKAEAQLMALSEQWAGAQRKTDAEFASHEVEKMRSAKAFLESRGETRALAESKSVTADKDSSPFPAIPESERVFHFDDPFQPGEIVTLGYLVNDRLRPPKRLADRTNVIKIDARSDVWVAVNADGEVLVEGPRAGWAKPPATAPRVSDLFLGDVVVGFDSRRRALLWGTRPVIKEYKLPPFDAPVTAFDTFREFNSLAILDGGKLVTWGTNYARKPLPWLPMPEITDAIDCAATDGLRAVIRRNGTLVCWLDRKPLDLPAEMKAARFAKLDSTAIRLMALTQDGRVFRLSRTDPWSMPPEGLNDVVDIAIGPALCLALRANGEWVAWGKNEDRLLSEIPKLKGVRRVAIGGNEEVRFIVGIQYPE